MGEQYSILSLNKGPDPEDRSPSIKPAEPAEVLPAKGLFPCPDCQHNCSTHAEACPSCGRFFQSYNRKMEVTPGDGWSIAVGWGVILGWIFAGVIIGLIVVALFILGSLVRPR